MCVWLGALVCMCACVYLCVCVGGGVGNAKKEQDEVSALWNLEM